MILKAAETAGRTTERPTTSALQKYVQKYRKGMVYDG
jgi:hypothetical protein